MNPKKLKLVLMLAITLVLAGTTFSFAQNPDKDELVKRIQEYAIAYNKGDAKAAASLYAVNGYHAYASGITHQGRTQIEQGLSESFEGPMKGTQIILNSDDIRFISSSIAYEHSSFLLSGVKMPDGTAIPTIKGYCLGVYEKQDGVWYALAMQCMVPLTPPQ